MGYQWFTKLDFNLAYQFDCGNLRDLCGNEQEVRYGLTTIKMLTELVAPGQNAAIVAFPC